MKTIDYHEMHKYIYNMVDYDIKGDLLYAYRFTKNQRECFQKDVMFDVLSQSSSGVTLEFKTTGNHLNIKLKRSKFSSLVMIALKRLGFKKLLDMALVARNRIVTYGHKSKIVDYIEVFVANQLVYSSRLNKNVIKIKFENDQHVHLPVKIYLPLYFPIGIHSIHSNGKIEPLEEIKDTWLALGDSITQGFNANQPTRNYVQRLASKLNLNVINQGLGGHYFEAESLDFVSNQLKLITVLYGTNDYEVYNDLKIIKKNISTYFERLAFLYPKVKIIVITPIWRKDYDDYLSIQALDQIREEIIKVAKKYPLIDLIDGLSLLEHNDKYYADGFLHPNQLGFEKMTLNLYEQIKSKI